MTPQQEAREIVRGLSEAQREAVLSLPADGQDRYNHERRASGALPAVRRKGLADPGWSAFGDKPWRLTPLGLLVRTLLTGASNAAD